MIGRIVRQVVKLHGLGADIIIYEATQPSFVEPLEIEMPTFYIIPTPTH